MRKDKEGIEAVLKLAAKNGYKSYIHESKFYCYGWMFTPSGNVLYVQKGEWGGFEFSLQYRPSRETGTGCQCFEEPVWEVDIETLRRAEEEGVVFAKRLGAKLYSSPEEWLNSYWDRENVFSVAAT